MADRNDRGSLFLRKIVEATCTGLKLQEDRQDNAAYRNIMILSNQDIHFKMPI
jgi:hypothetical protein